MNYNNNSVMIEIEEREHNSEQFDENAENCELYNVKISSEGKEQSFTIKAQTVKVPNLTFKRRKITIMDNKNTSMTYFIDGKEKHIKGTNDASNDLKKFNNNDDINKIIDVLKYNKNIERKNQSINLCFKSKNENTYECNEYEKYKPYDYKIVNEADLKSLINRSSEGIQTYVADTMIGNTFGRVEKIANSYNQVAIECLDVFRNIKNIFK